MIILRTFSDNSLDEKELSPEEKKKLYKRGKEAGAILTGLGSATLITRQLGKAINNGKIDPDLADKLVSKRVNKAIKKQVDAGVKNIDKAKVQASVLEKLNRQPIPNRVLKGAKKAGIVALAAGIPLTAYAGYKLHKAKQDDSNKK